MDDYCNETTIIPLCIKSIVDMNNIFPKIFKRTTKNDVKSIINIPIITEKIMWIEQTNIERNIYNSYKNTHNSRWYYTNDNSNNYDNMNAIIVNQFVSNILTLLLQKTCQLVDDDVTKVYTRRRN